MKLYNEDCLDILKTIPNESIYLVVTDPPYKVISGGNDCGVVINTTNENKWSDLD